MDVIKRFSKASLVWLLFWPVVSWQAAVTSVRVFREAYRANSVNPKDWDMASGLPRTRRRS